MDVVVVVVGVVVVVVVVSGDVTGFRIPRFFHGKKRDFDFGVGEMPSVGRVAIRRRCHPLVSIRRTGLNTAYAPSHRICIGTS